MSRIQDNNQSKDFSARFSKEFWRTPSKKSEILALFILIILLIALMVISIVIKSDRPIFIFLLIFGVCYLILIAIPLIWILIKIAVRTHRAAIAT